MPPTCLTVTACGNVPLNSDSEPWEDGKDVDGKPEDGDRGLESSHEMLRCKHCGRPFGTEKRMVEHELKCGKKAKAIGGSLKGCTLMSLSLPVREDTCLRWVADSIDMKIFH